jgi:ribonuclease HII
MGAGPAISSATAELVAGIDEVGRGCLAGPVYAAAVILPPDHGLEGLRDSKQLSAAQRERLAPLIRARALAWAIGTADVEEIDRRNILQATFLAMRRAVAGLAQQPMRCLVDGNQRPPLELPVEMIVGGDASVDCIMAAAIVAKVARDAVMRSLDGVYPGYGFAQNKGYGTPAHLAALRERGPCAVHRMSFAPCAQAGFQFPVSGFQNGSRRPDAENARKRKALGFQGGTERSRAFTGNWKLETGNSPQQQNPEPDDSPKGQP